MKIFLYITLITFSLSLYGMSQQEKQFMAAILTNDINAARSLITTIDINKRINNLLPLEVAIEKQYLEMTKLILDHRADINKIDPESPFTPLLLAAKVAIQGNLEFINLLLTYNPDLAPLLSHIEYLQNTMPFSADLQKIKALIFTIQLNQGIPDLINTLEILQSQLVSK